MGATSTGERFPRAHIAQGNGDLARVTDFSIRYSNSAAQVHTLREDGAGIQYGPRECEISYNFVVGANGLERDYVRKIHNKELDQVRAKLPGGRNITVNGAYSQVSLDSSVDGATKGSCTFVGKAEKD